MTHTMPSNTYQWVAGVARALPEATFWRGKRRRDNLTRVGVSWRGHDREFVVERIAALDAVFMLRSDEEQVRGRR